MATTKDAMKGMKWFRVLAEVSVAVLNEEEVEQAFFDTIKDSPNELTIISMEEE